jgi:hypothetical protein
VLAVKVELVLRFARHAPRFDKKAQRLALLCGASR